MKTIEITPDGKADAIPRAEREFLDGVRNELLLAALPHIVHKIKNKLTPVLGYAAILQARSADDFFRDRLGRIEKNMADVSQALTLLKDYAAPLPRLRERVDLNALVAGMAACWQRIANEAQARVVLDLAPGLAPLDLDPRYVRFALLALAENAVLALAGREGGREIRIASAASAGGQELSLRDNGRGLGAEEQALAWTPFYSGFAGRSGLGLTLCQQAVEQLGGSCRLEAAPGAYCRVAITFPTAGSQTPPTAPPADKEDR